MTAAVIDPRNESPALRRAAVLLERVRQDGKGVDSELDALAAGVSAMQRLAAGGGLVRRTAVDAMQTVLARLAPPATCPFHASTYELLRWNALVETRDVLGRLSRAGLPKRGSHPSVSATTDLRVESSILSVTA